MCYYVAKICSFAFFLKINGLKIFETYFRATFNDCCFLIGSR